MVLVFITRGMKADFMREYYDFWPLDNSNWRIPVGKAIRGEIFKRFERT